MTSLIVKSSTSLSSSYFITPKFRFCLNFGINITTYTLIFILEASSFILLYLFKLKRFCATHQSQELLVQIEIIFLCRIHTYIILILYIHNLSSFYITCCICSGSSLGHRDWFTLDYSSKTVGPQPVKNVYVMWIKYIL